AAVGASVRPSAASAANVAAMAMVGEQVLASVWTASASASMLMVAQTSDNVDGELTSSGQASASFVGQLIAPAVLVASGQAAFDGVGSVAGDGSVTIQGQGSLSGVGEV